MKKLKITKNNYKGYVAFYLNRDEMSDSTFICIERTISFIIATVIIIGVLSFIGLFPAMLTLFCTLMSVSLVDDKFVMNKIFKTLKQKYPYLERYSSFTIEKALKDVNIIKSKKIEGKCSKVIDVKSYENSLKYQKVEQKVADVKDSEIQPTIDFNFTDVEPKENPKVKVIQRFPGRK